MGSNPTPSASYGNADMTGRWTVLAGCLVLAGVFAEPVLGEDDPPQGSVANVFISPGGKVYRAKDDAPYPMADWFKAADTNADGKLDKAEFIADAAAFFKVLDRNADGILTPSEIAFYEQRIAPEVLGFRVIVDFAGEVRRSDPRLLLAQATSGGIDRPSSIDPGGDRGQDAPHGLKLLDESGAGASPFSFFDEPEPVMAADLHFRGTVSRADYLQLAAIHFQTLDARGLGYLTLATLPKTPMEIRLQRTRRHR